MNYLNLFLFFLIFSFLAFSVPVKRLPKESMLSNISAPSMDKKTNEINPVTTEQKNSDLDFTEIERKISNANLEAKAAYVFDLKSEKEIFNKDSEIALPLASLAKLMTAVIAKETLNDEEVISISKEALAQEGVSGFYLNEKWKVKDLIDIMLVSSSNDAAQALTEAIDEKIKNAEVQKNTLELMNKKAVKLNMKNTVYFNSTGLDINEKAGNYGSAKDTFILVDYILKNHPEILKKTGSDSFTAYSIDQDALVIKNTNLSLNQLNQIIYGKTGFTDIAGGNLAIIFDLGFNRPIVLIILGSSFDGRFKDALKITKIIYENRKDS